jgi:hypothetical protein
MTPTKENLYLPAPIEDMINKALDTRTMTHDQRQPYRARMKAVKDALSKAIEIFDKQK